MGDLQAEIGCRGVHRPGRLLVFGVAASVSLIVAATAALGAPAQPTAQDMLDGYNYNRTRDIRLHVTIEYRFKSTEASIAAAQRRAEAIDRELSSASAPIAEKAALRSERASLILALPPPRQFLFDYWTDGTGFQVRAIKSGTVGAKLPRVPPSPSNLESQYRDIAVASYDGSSAILWGGTGANGKGGGLVGNGPSDIAPGGFEFPPLAWSGDPGGIPRNPIDDFYSAQARDLTVVGTEENSGHRCIVIERTIARPARDAGIVSLKAPDLQQFQIVRGAVDPQRGYLPVKIEWRMELVSRGKQLSGQPVGTSEPYKALEVTSVRRMDGGEYYPMEGRVTTFGPDAAHWDGVIHSVDAAIDDGTISKSSPVAAHFVTSWRVSEISVGQPLGRGFFAFQFPKGTSFFDMRKNKGFIQGMTEKELNAIWEKQVGRPGPPPTAEIHSRGSWGPWLIAGNIVVIAILLFIAIRIRRGH